jgi:hypothetical protein
MSDERIVKIEARSPHTFYVTIDGLKVGNGSEVDCVALVDELAEDTTGKKTEALYQAFATKERMV